VVRAELQVRVAIRARSRGVEAGIGAEHPTPLGALKHRRPAGLHLVLSVRAHPTPFLRTTWPVTSQPNSRSSPFAATDTGSSGARVGLLKASGPGAERAGTEISRAAQVGGQATTRAPFCQTHQ